MAASGNRRDLYLQVDGNIDPFKRAMKAASGVLVDFKGDVAAQLKAIEDNFSTLGGQGAEASLRQLENNFRRTFSAINAAARDAGKDAAPLSILNAKDAQAAAVAAEQQAAALRVVADAAGQAAIRINDASSAEAQFARASLAAALAKEDEAAALRTQAQVLSRVQDELVASGRAEVVANDEVTASHGRMGASGMILQHVLRSTTDSFVAGLPPAMIFGEQIGRLGEAAALSGGALGAFGEFMAGPWGLLITGAVAIAGTLVAKLHEAKDAADIAKLGNDGLSEAQGVLGKMFDLTSGKLQKQNDLLRINALLTRDNLIAQAAANEAKAKVTFSDASAPGAGSRAAQGSINLLSGIGSYLTTGSPIDLAAALGSGLSGLASGTVTAQNNSARLRQISGGVQSGKLSLEDALNQADKADFGGTGATATQFKEALAAIASARTQRQGAADIDQSLKDGKLTNDLLNPSNKKPKADHSVEHAANRDAAYQGELDKAQQDLARAQLALADTAEARYKVSVDELTAARVQRDKEIADQLTAGKISASQAERLHTLNEQTTAAKLQKALEDEQVAILQRKRDADLRELDDQAASLQLQASLAQTTKERRDIALKLLAIEEQRERTEAHALIAHGTLTGNAQEVAQGNDQLAQVDALDKLRKRQINEQNADPLQAYFNNLKRHTADMNEALKGVEADGLQGLEDGLLGVITGTESVASAFKKMAQSIIADLARIAIEKAIVNALPGLFGLNTGGIGIAAPGHATGMIPGFAGGLISGPGTGTSDSILAILGGTQPIRVSNGESIINAASTRRYRPLLKAINDGTLPGFADGLLPDAAQISYPAIPSMRDLAPARQSGGAITFDLRGAVMTEDLLAQMQQIATQTSGAVVRATAPQIVEAAKLATFNETRRPRL